MGAVQVHKMCTKSAKAKIKVTLSPVSFTNQEWSRNYNLRSEKTKSIKNGQRNFIKPIWSSPLPRNIFHHTLSNGPHQAKSLHQNFIVSSLQFFFSTADNCILVQKVKFSHISQRNKISYMGNHLSSFPYC